MQRPALVEFNKQVVRLYPDFVREAPQDKGWHDMTFFDQREPCIVVAKYGQNSLIPYKSGASELDHKALLEHWKNSLDFRYASKVSLSIAAEHG